MPDYSNAEQTALSSVDDHDRYLLHSPTEIRNELLNLAKKPDIISAYFNNGNDFILTAVLGVLSDRGLLVLDVGPDDAITRRAIAGDKLVCTTRSNGVPIKFTCTGLRSAKFQGHAAIAAAIPATLHRQQRREYFRVSAPRINSPLLILQDPQDNPLELCVLDVSIGGLCLTHLADGFHPEILDEFHDALLRLPDFGELTVSIQIRNQGRFVRGAEILPRFGATFLHLGMQENLQLQRYLYHLQTLAAATQ